MSSLGTVALERVETETALSREQYDLLWPVTFGKRLEKRRYYIEYRNKIIELDIYKAPLDNLILAEVEFYSELDARDFVAPNWFDLEVTNDEKYNNAKLVFAYLQKAR